MRVLVKQSSPRRSKQPKSPSRFSVGLKQPQREAVSDEVGPSYDHFKHEEGNLPFSSSRKPSLIRKKSSYNLRRSSGIAFACPSSSMSLGVRFVTALAVFVVMLYNISISMTIRGGMENISHALPSELALAVQQGVVEALSMANVSDGNRQKTTVFNTVPTSITTKSVSSGLRRAAVTKRSTQISTLSHVETSNQAISIQLPPYHERKKLQEKIDQLWHSRDGKQPYSPSIDGPLWKLSDWCPQWMRSYFDWHTKEKKRLKETIALLQKNYPRLSDLELWDKLHEVTSQNNHPPFKFMVMQCIDGIDRQCGGTADRIKLFPYWIQQAAENRRILLIYWTSPARLEEFMVPPLGGIDWRVPDWMVARMHDRENIGL